MNLFLQTTIVMTLLLSACAQKEVKKETVKMPGSRYTTLLFNPGKSELGQENKQAIQDFKTELRRSNFKVENIKILAWPDSEYPENVKGKAARKEIDLAQERAQKVKEYLIKELKEDSSIDAYNMAKKPDLFSSFMRNDEYKVKKAYEESGTTASRLPDGSVSYTKASKALIIINE